MCTVTLVVPAELAAERAEGHDKTEHHLRMLHFCNLSISCLLAQRFPFPSTVPVGPAPSGVAADGHGRARRHLRVHADDEAHCDTLECR